VLIEAEARRLLSSAGMRFQAPRCVGQGLHELFLDHADWFEVDEETCVKSWRRPDPQRQDDRVSGQSVRMAFKQERGNAL